ncbi:pectinesterase/polygalacturonase [Granulicella rosea]|uniref:Pectinesterase n=1 Tax=Granulicella rosea TaxID=474952 RepID=A0A239M6V4_9BACT|nr:pectinesterase family protein [Granulicella rosea]SNT37794.1 pectinesterase/polygalacturonase [Granulicella rosea]
MSRRRLLISCLAVLLPTSAVASPLSGKKELTVGPGGRGQFRTVQAAIDAAPSDKGAIIRLAPGVYHEKVSIEKPGIVLVGSGSKPSDTVITWGDSSKNTGSTFTSGTVTVSANGFEAENLSIVNTWWDEHPLPEDRSQAVALQMDSDRAILDRVRIVSAQDTLYANGDACHGDLTRPCRAYRQFFNDCFVEGSVDYIFGNAKAVFNHCELHSRPGSGVMITAQSRQSLQLDSGYFMLHCSITGEDGGKKIFLGRPWRDYATVLFYDTEIVQKIDPAGWGEWGDRLKTATYREYRSHGPGVNGDRRSVIYSPLTPEEEKGLTPAALLAGGDHWNPEAELEQLRRLP